MVSKLNIISLVFLMLISSCRKYIYKDDELVVPQQNYTGNELKINGYFFHKTGNPERMDIIILYSNGIMLEGGSPESTNIIGREEEFKNGEFYNSIKDKKYYWGRFQINEQCIRLNSWGVSEIPLSAYIKEGDILNDTTFHISRSFRSKKGKVKNDVSSDQTYHFKKFSPKPDSTNNFVK